MSGLVPQTDGPTPGSAMQREYTGTRQSRDQSHTHRQAHIATGNTHGEGISGQILYRDGQTPGEREYMGQRYLGISRTQKRESPGGKETHRTMVS